MAIFRHLVYSDINIILVTLRSQQWKSAHTFSSNISDTLLQSISQITIKIVVFSTDTVTFLNSSISHTIYSLLFFLYIHPLFQEKLPTCLCSDQVG